MPDLTTDLDGFHKIISTIDHFSTAAPDALEKLNELKDAVYDTVGKGQAAEVTLDVATGESEQVVRLKVE